MSLMWMPAQTTVPPGATAAQRERHERADGREDDRGVERLGRRARSEPPAHAAPSSRANACGRVVARAREGVDLAALPAATCARMCAAAPKP